MKNFLRIEAALALCALSLTACDHKGRMPIAPPPFAQTEVPVITVQTALVGWDEAISDANMKFAQTDAKPGNAARVRYRFNSGAYESISLLKMGVPQEGSEGCSVGSISASLLDESGKIVESVVSIGKLIPVSQKTDYLLELSRDSRCRLEGFTAFTVVMGKIGRPSDRGRGQIARRCSVDKSQVFFVNVNVGTPLSDLDRDSGGVFHMANTSSLCGPELSVGGTGTRSADGSVGLSDISRHIQMIVDPTTDGKPSLNFDLTFDDKTQYVTGTLVCQSGDKKTRALTSCVDVAIEFDLID